MRGVPHTLRLAVPEKLLGLLPPPSSTHSGTKDAAGPHAARLDALHRLMSDHVEIERLLQLGLIAGFVETADRDAIQAPWHSYPLKCDESTNPNLKTTCRRGSIT